MKRHFFTRRFFYGSIIVYSLVLLATSVIALLFGSETLNWRNVYLGLWQANTDSEIFFRYRLPRAILAICAGGSLALVGCAFQVILHNPLASPYTLGITNGGALGAVIAICSPSLYLPIAGVSTVQIFSLLGCSLTMLVLYYLARTNRTISMNTLLLTGVIIGIFCNALIVIIRYFVNPALLVTMDRWMLGSLSVIGYRELSQLLPFLLPGLYWLMSLAPAMNLLCFGNEMAVGYGINVDSVQKQTFLAGCLITAAIVSVAGAIGFVGLIIPHAVRMISGNNHILIFPGCFLLGGSFLLLCDTIARTIAPPTEIPVGVITALLGAPAFMIILLKNRT